MLLVELNGATRMTGAAADYRSLARLHLAKAGKLLDSADDEQVTYACLELRQAIEASCYSLLCAYLDEVPMRALESWQPKKVMKELLAIDPNVHRSKTIRIGRQETLGEPAEVMRELGEDRRLDPRWASKAYNTLGAFIHVPTIRQCRDADTPPPAKVRERALTIRDELARVLAATIWNCNMAEFATLECFCGAPVRRRSSVLEDGQEVDCGACGQIYETRLLADRKVEFGPIGRYWTCPACGVRREAWQHQLREGADMSCPACGDQVTIRIVEELKFERAADRAEGSEAPQGTSAQSGADKETPRPG
jgi:transcription elongation factor Elf1